MIVYNFNVIIIYIYRIPLNIFVVFLLLKVKLLSSANVFYICGVAHMCSFICYFYFYVTSKENVMFVELTANTTNVTTSNNNNTNLKPMSIASSTPNTNMRITTNTNNRGAYNRNSSEYDLFMREQIALAEEMDEDV